MNSGGLYEKWRGLDARGAKYELNDKFYKNIISIKDAPTL